MDYNSKNYSVQIIPLKSGTYFLGNMILMDTNYYIAKDYIKDNFIESYETNLTSQISNSILRIAKNLRIEQIQVEDDKNLMTAFEYPEGTGLTYSISRSQFSYYNSMMIFKDSFSYPFEFLGNDGASINFVDATGLASFIGLALQKHQEIYNTKYLVAVNQINSITVDSSLETAINNVLNINY